MPEGLERGLHGVAKHRCAGGPRETEAQESEAARAPETVHRLRERLRFFARDECVARCEELGNDQKVYLAGRGVFIQEGLDGLEVLLFLSKIG